MNVKIVLVLGIMSFVFACKEVKQKECYDSVNIIEYKNIYDGNNRLLNVEGTEHQYMYYGDENKKEFLVGTYHHTSQYHYDSDTSYTVTEFSGSANETRITKYTGKTKEELILKDGKDTVKYSYTIYYDKDKPEYTKTVQKFGGDPSSDENKEEFYYYDINGYNTRIDRNDLNTGEKEVICNLEQKNGDTIVSYTSINGVPGMVTKEYPEGTKKVSRVLNNEIEFIDIQTEYEKDGLKINVTENVSPIGCMTDSIYYKNGIKIRTNRYYSGNNLETVTLSEYDEQGNIIKEVQKSKQKKLYK